MTSERPSSSPPTHALAIVSLVFGIIAWVALPIVGAILAVIFGQIALGDIRIASQQHGGANLARAGLTLGCLQLVLLAAALLFVVALALARGSIPVSL